MPSFVYIIILPFFILLSAFFSSAEIVYATVNKIKLNKSAESGNKKAFKAYSLANNPTSLVTTVLVGNNLVNIAASSVATLLASNIWGEKSGPTIATFGMTFIILIFGEILPKTVTSRLSYTCSLLFSNVMTFFIVIFKPITCAVNSFVDKISKIWTPKEKHNAVTDEELITMVDEIEEEGYIDEETGDLVRSAIDFIDVDAYEIMTPRVDVFAFDIDDDIEELISDENIFSYSRVPVYKETIDHIVGILNTKELLKKVISKDIINIEEMLTEPIYVHKTKAISAILKDFKQTNTHIAVVADEFGGTMGIITLEDILEELVGDIWDEIDEIEEEYQEKSDGEYIVDGDMNIYDFFELLEKDSKDFESEYSTVGGWCTEILEKFPQVNDHFVYENLNITILEVDGMRVEKVRVQLILNDDE